MEELEIMLLAYALGGIFSSRSLKEENYLGTQTPYVYQPTNDTPPPKGYVPFYINHLGRHGARYLTSPRALKLWFNVLSDAKAHQALTEKGEHLQKQVQKLSQLEKGNYGLLTTSGKEMEAGIAKRMYEAFPQVFGKKVIAVSTYVERTKESMGAFLEELSKYTQRKKFQITSNGKIDPLLRFFDLNTAYLAYKKHGKWKEEVKKYEKRRDYATELLSQFFSEAYLQKIENKEGLASDLYEMYTNQFDVEDLVGLGKYFTQEQLRYYWENKNLSTYLEKGPSNIGEDLPTDIAFALLGDFLVTTEHAIGYQDVSANLRFAHAETIIPFASLLKLLGYATQTNDLREVARIWQDEKVAPMAANIWWVLYKNDETDDILIKVLYNEQEIELPIESTMKPYYRWKDVKAYYVKLLEILGINWNGNIVEMVKNYKVK